MFRDPKRPEDCPTIAKSVRSHRTNQGIALTERLLRAASVVRFHREFVECRLISPSGAMLECELVGAGRKPGTVKVRTWWKGQAEQPVSIKQIELPADTARRLEVIADQQNRRAA